MIRHFARLGQNSSSATRRFSNCFDQKDAASKESFRDLAGIPIVRIVRDVESSATSNRSRRRIAPGQQSSRGEAAP
jgi:hypothetical protein